MLMSRYSVEPDHWISHNVGIQKGTTASSESSIKIDTVVKTQSKRVYEDLSKEYNIAYQIKLQRNQIPHGVGALSPDGGIMFYGDLPFLIVEAKFQLDRGNAIERWYKNEYIARKINPSISYLTFATGSGVLQNNPIYNTLYIAHDGVYNVMRPNKNTAFLSSNGFDELTVYNIIRELAIQTLKGLIND
jgi:hypothetical protein